MGLAHMTTERTLERELARLRKRQNPTVVDLRQMRKLRAAHTKYWKRKKRAVNRGEEAVEVPKSEPKKEKKKEKEPELEVLDE